MNERIAAQAIIDFFRLLAADALCEDCLAPVSVEKCALCGNHPHTGLRPILAEDCTCTNCIARLARCPIKCECVECGGCKERTDDPCKLCKRCSECCECAHCDSCSRACESTCEDGLCGRCCSAYTCRRCDGHVESICNNCERCEECCECARCNECSEPVRRTCGGCDCCDGCCSCGSNERSDRFFFKSNLKFHVPKITEVKLNPSKRMISAEIEVADLTGSDGEKAIKAVVSKWSGSIVEDGSLPSSGFEINTAPAGGDLWVRQINEICTTLRAGGASVNGQCGLHVHLDARDFDYYAVRRLITVYARIEDAIFSMVPESRRRNNYCSPCGKEYLAAIQGGRLPYKQVKKAIWDGIYGPPEKFGWDGGGKGADAPEARRALIRKNKYHGMAGAEKHQDRCRYNALNLHSWFYRGTVECRLFVGTVMADKIIPWGRMWATILDWVQARTDEEVERDLADARTTLQALRKILGKDSKLQDFVTERRRVSGSGSDE